MSPNNPAASYFDYNGFQKLIDETKNNPEDQEILVDVVKSCNNYVTAVDAMEVRIKVAQFRFDTAEFQEIVKDLDNQRRRHHEDAIACTNMLNRIAALYKVSPIFTGDISNRYEVADFCLEVTKVIFENRTVNFQLLK